MVAIDTIEGIINSVLWFHYSISDDVLYLRKQSARETEALGEETDDGLILLRAADTEELVGITVVDWWKRFGVGELPDSLLEIERQIEPWGKRVAAGLTSNAPYRVPVVKYARVRSLPHATPTFPAGN